MQRAIKTTQVNPDFSAGDEFVRTVSLPNGVIDSIQFDVRGTLTGTITTVNADGLARMVDPIRIEFPRADGRPYVIEAPLRDLFLLSKLLTKRGPRVLWPTGATAAYLRFELPLGIVNSMFAQRHRWGIDTRELSGPITISGRWAAAAAYGQTSTGFTAGQLRLSFAVDVAEDRNLPRAVLIPQTNRIPIESAQKVKHILNTGSADGLFGVMFRTFDTSDSGDADRPDGLITAVRIEHTEIGELVNEFFDGTKERMAAYFGLPVTELTAAAPQGFLGVGMSIFNPKLVPERYVAVDGQRIDVEVDAETTQLTGVTDVTPAAGDLVFALSLGIQANLAALERAVA